jgi:glutathione peroxidase
MATTHYRNLAAPFPSAAETLRLNDGFEAVNERMTMRRKAIGAILALTAAFGAAPGHAVSPQACNDVLDYSFPALDTGKPRSLCEFSGKVVLIVNTASQCGYTPQYEGLEALYKRYHQRGLVVLGFPSNDFGGQEPGSNKEVAEFCKLNYGVSFPMFEKIAVTGPKPSPIYATLAQRAGAAPRWNFHKYLIDRSGSRIASYASDVAPADPRLTRQIERLLAEPVSAK